ncbi:MAG TPA: type II DNA modification enzyme, partial [Phycisphaerales bacterium]|nr:type II DNA modification enzyme [Phycisphaerales bacterium]
MQISRRNIFTTIKTEGGLLPADLLVRIAEGDPAVEGLTPEAYHLAKSERLNEAANRAWNRLKGAWEGFKAASQALPESDAGTTLTRERWLLILFQELGYGRLTTRKAYEIEGKTYPISHEWQATPIHLVSFRQELDRRTPGARGASRVSPHSLVQELLNRGENLLWGFVSNGLVLRLLRDNVSLTRQAYVEFDLQAMMDSEAYSDFFLLFLLCHQSRVEVPEGKTPEHCWLERWYNTSLREGTRVLDRLRDGVEQAIQALGGGFLAHPANQALRERLRSGDLTTQDYYRQVLRVVYRLLFLFVAEDRDLLLLPAEGDAALAAARELYIRHYSTQRLRRLAERRRSARHADLYRALRLVFGKLHTGCPELALPALGSFLFSPQSTPDLSDADIANADLLEAVRNLTFTVEGSVRRWGDYRNLRPGELGSGYESLLEMHPDVNLDAGRFTL